jgi:hypothetical protein
MHDQIPAEFARIAAPEINLIRIPRLPDTGLRAAAARTLAAADPDFDVQASLAEVDTTLAARGVEPALAADMADLARALAGVAGACALRLRFERVTGPACKLFHVDWIGCRLIVAYAGAGTEYLRDEDVRRDRLARGTNRGVARPGAAVRHLDAFEIGLFKGEAWPGNRGKGIVHRSPPATSAKPRLVFVADALCAHPT